MKRRPMPMELWGIAATSILLLAACWTDLKTLRIPNVLTLTFACSGMLYHVVIGGLPGLEWSVTGTVAGMLPLFILYKMQGMGGGDVKWFGAFGAWMGVIASLQLLVYAIVCGGIIAALLLACRYPPLRLLALRLKWPWGAHPAAGGRGIYFPFMLAVAPGYLMLLGERLG